MADSLTSRVQVFDPAEEYSVVFRRGLPHWSQPGTICFITWRTWDSIPANVLERWLTERDAWLRIHGINPTGDHWRRQVESLNSLQRREFQLLLSDRWNEHLDACHGECVLRQHELANVVADSLRHFDGDRYDLTDFVVMPNHVHLSAAFPDEHATLEQCDSWKHSRQQKSTERLAARVGSGSKTASTTSCDPLSNSITIVATLPRMRCGPV
jgi:hypothetical protein